MSEVDSGVPSGLDELLGSIRSGESPVPKKRGRKKKEAPAKDFKAVLWASADKLRAQMDAAEYKHLVLGLIFLKYISDTFEDSFALVSNLHRTAFHVRPHDVTPMFGESVADMFGPFIASPPPSPSYAAAPGMLNASI